MKSMKAMGVFLLLLTLFAHLLPASAAAVSPNGELGLQLYNETTGKHDDVTVSVVRLSIDGSEMGFTGDIPAVVQTINGQGRTLAPLRAVGEALGATVLWSQENRQAILRKGDTTVVLTLGSATAMVNGVETPLPDGVPANSLNFKGQNGRTMVPLRFVVEQLGAKVDWVQEKYAAQIIRPAPASTLITRVTANHDTQTVLIATDRPPVFQVTDFGGKIAVDLLGAELASGFAGTITVDNDLITTVRYAQHDSSLYPAYEKSVRVVLDLREGLTLEKNATVEQTEEGILLTTTLTDDDMEELPPPELPPIDPGKKTIVLDAGHGGIKSGAVYEGIMEKDLTLPMTLILERKLLDMGYNVIMTRRTDEHVDLYERAAIANAAKADAFISIHCNAIATKRDFQGIFTYFHPSSERGRRLALTLQPYMAKASGGIDRGVMKDDFVVLRETEMVAVLVETGFMTNHEELMNLANPIYQEKLMQGVADGLTAYLNGLK